LDTTATSIDFQAKAAFGMKVNGRFDQYESAITVGASVAESERLNVTGTLRVRDVSQYGRLTASGNAYRPAQCDADLMGFRGTRCAA
jgi:polyisoprenoid-binding protein YceI